MKKRRAQSESKTTYHHGDLKEALLAAALKLVDEKGVYGFTMNEACRIALVSNAAPYRHFQDKDSLLAEVARRGFIEFSQALLSSTENTPRGSMERLREIGHAYLHFAFKQPAQYQVMFGWRGRFNQFPELDAEVRQAFAQLLNCVEECISAKTILSDNPMISSMIIWSSLHGLVKLILDGVVSHNNALPKSTPFQVFDELIDKLSVQQ